MWVEYKVVAESDLESELLHAHFLFDEYESPIRYERACLPKRPVLAQIPGTSDPRNCYVRYDAMYAILVFDEDLFTYRRDVCALHERGWRIGATFENAQLTPQRKDIFREQFGRTLTLPARSSMNGKLLENHSFVLVRDKNLESFIESVVDDIVSEEIARFSQNCLEDLSNRNLH